jgi:hypothetical protein
MGALREVAKGAVDVQRARTDLPVYEGQALRLFKIVNATSISGQDARWTYGLQRVVVEPSSGSYVAVNSATTARTTGISVSELSNPGTSYSYGILASNIPTGFAAVRIPTGTIVAAFPVKLTDGALLWIIVNTQAIDGQCTALTGGDVDGGSYSGAA